MQPLCTVKSKLMFHFYQFVVPFWKFLLFDDFPSGTFGWPSVHRGETQENTREGVWWLDRWVHAGSNWQVSELLLNVNFPLSSDAFSHVASPKQIRCDENGISFISIVQVWNELPNSIWGLRQQQRLQNPQQIPKPLLLLQWWHPR